MIYIPLFIVYLVFPLIPLATSFGQNLEYEYTTLLAWQYVYVFPFLACVLPRSWLGADSGSHKGLFFLMAIVAPLINTLPAIVLFYSRWCLCSFPGFWFWMGVQTFPSFLLGHGLFYLIVRWRQEGWKSWVAAVVLFGFLLLCSLWAGGILWFQPQKRITNLFLGFLHGPIYDEWLPIDEGILLARLAHVILALILLRIAWIRKSAWVYFSFAVLVSGWFLATIKSKSYRSVGAGVDLLVGTLPQTMKGEGFNIYTPDFMSQVDVQRLFVETTFHYQELVKILNLEAPPFVQLFVYATEDQKKLVFGAGGTDVTDVATPSIHMTMHEIHHPTLRHELVHALASSFSYKRIGFHPNMTFTEGLAVGLAPEKRSLTLDEGALSIIQSGRIPSPQDLFNPAKFWSVSGDRAYTTSGSLIQFLIKEYGIDAVKTLYGGQSMNTALKLSEKQVFSRWQAYLEKTVNTENIKIQAEALYRSPGVLSEKCPHSKVDLARPRDQSFSIRLRQPIGWDPERDYEPWRLELEPNNLGIKVQSLQKEIRKLMQERVEPGSRYDRILADVIKLRNTPAKVIEDLDLALLETDLYRLLGDQKQSLFTLAKLQEELTKHPAGQDYERQLHARLMVESVLPKEQGYEWRKYLAGWRNSILPDVYITPEPWILQYLRLKKGSAGYKSREELLSLLFLPLPPQLPVALNFEWHRLLSQRLADAKEFQRAASLLKQSLKLAPPASIPYYDEKVRLYSFFDQWKIR